MRGYSDRKRLDPDDNNDLVYWARKWGVTSERVREAAAKVGRRVDDVAAEIGEDLYYSIRPQA